MPKQNTFLFLIAALLLSASCTHYYYAPNTIRTPFLCEQHDTHVDLGFVTGDEFEGYELHGLYSPVKYGAVMVNYLNVGSGNEGDNEMDWGKGHLAEIAVGGYYPLGKHTSLSLFGGWGGGRVLNGFPGNALADLHFQRTFLQPTAAFRFKWFQLGSALRINRLRYVKGDIDFQIGEDNLDVIRNIEAASPIYFTELGLNAGLGYGPCWGFVHLNTVNMDNHTDLGFGTYSISASFHMELNHFWKKNREARRKKREER